jgi:hypothetical protein
VLDVVVFLLWAALPAAVFGLATHAGSVGRLLRRTLRWVRPPAPVPAAVPLERIASDLRRLARLIQSYEIPGAAVPVAKRRAAQRAYEDRLADACAALGVPHRLATTSGWEHAFELSTVEWALLDAGLAFAPPIRARRDPEAA